MKKPFVPFDQFERECVPETKPLAETMQENCNERLAPIPEPCANNCVPYWQQTGEQSCSNSPILEMEEVDGCGHTRWVRTKHLVTWTDTGNIENNEETGERRVEQVNQCGDLRWVSSFIPQLQIHTQNSASVNFSGSGRSSSPLQAVVRRSGEAGNILQTLADGLHVPALTLDANPLNLLSFVGGSLLALTRISPDPNNQIEGRANGIYLGVPPSELEIGADYIEIGSSLAPTRLRIQFGAGEAPGNNQLLTTAAVAFVKPFTAMWGMTVTPMTAGVSDLTPPGLPSWGVTGWTFGAAATDVTVNFRIATDAGGDVENNINHPVPFNWIAFGLVANEA